MPPTTDSVAQPSSDTTESVVPPNRSGTGLSARVGHMYASRTEHVTIEITDLGTFLCTELPEDTVVTFAKEANVVILDGDVHHWTEKPTNDFLVATAATITPPPDHWYISHGHGWKGIYTGLEARQRAAIAALSLPKDFTAELATEFRHPAARSSKHGCIAGPVQSNPNAQQEKASFRQVGTLRRGEVIDFLKAQGKVLGERYPHDACPIAGHEPSDAGNCVQTLDAGFYCYRCAGKGLHYKSIRKPGFVPYSMLVDGAATVIERLVEHRIHWEQAQHELAHEYPNLRASMLQEVYRAALVQHYSATDPRIPKAFNPELRILYTSAGWVDAKTFIETKLDNDIVDHMPAVQDLEPPADHSGSPVIAVNRVRRSTIKSRLPAGLTPIRPFRGICFANDPATIAVEAPPRLQFKIEILADPLPLDEAFGRLLLAFPGMSQSYLVGSMAAMICGHMGGAQPPGLTATGPSGSGKGETLAVSASCLGDEPMKVQLDDSAEVFMRSMGSSTAAGYGCLVLDEFGKTTKLAQKLAALLQVGSRITYRPLYVTGNRTVPFRSALFFPCVRFPDFLRVSPEFLRRTRGVHLTSRVPNWMATSGGDAAAWRHRSKENALVGNSILTHAYRMCAEAKFVFDGTSDCVANRLELGSIGDGAEGIDPDHLRNLFRYARGQLGTRTFFEKDLTFTKGWLDLAAPQAKALITVFASGDDRDPNVWKRSVQMNLEAASWNDVLGFADPPVAIDIKIHGSRWGLRFRKAVNCVRGAEILNEALPPIPSDQTATVQPVATDAMVASPPTSPPAAPQPNNPSNPLAIAGFPG